MIRKAEESDHAGIVALYRTVASTPGGIARRPDEVSDAYVRGFMQEAAQGGLEFVYEKEGVILGEIHAASPGIACFAHVLSDLTIAVSPLAQGQGVGRRLFQALLDEVTHHMPAITRVELFARDSNKRARALYESLGFVEEGRLRARIIDATGQPETDTIMGWIRK
jgi:putative acetyltransferase